jgi:hypothetical protein
MLRAIMKGEKCHHERKTTKGLSDATVQFLKAEQAMLLQTINGLRDAAQHHCVFRSMPATSSGACRAMIPVHVGPPFRSMPAGGCDAG